MNAEQYATFRSMSTVNVEGSLRWESRFIFSLNRNEITDLYGDGRDDLGNSWFIGQPISAIYDYERTGGIWTEEELYSGEIHKGFYPGQFRLRDFNNDGRIHSDEDRTIVGYATPNYRVGLRGLQLYVNGKNLYPWTNWDGYDPEIANFQTPMMRVVTGGFRLDI